MIEIIRYTDPHVSLYGPNDELIGVLYNYHEMLRIQIQICEQNLIGYYLVWGDTHININNNGELDKFPRGLYDDVQQNFATLFRIRKEKGVYDTNSIIIKN